MSETLLIRLRALDPASPAQWCVQVPVVAADSGPPRKQTGMQTGTLADALAAGGTRPVVLIVPGEDVLLTEVNLPIRQTTKLLQAVPYALEERLADDPEILHFALGARQKDGQIAVAVVARQKMDAWIALLRDAGLQPHAIVPETLCLPMPAPGSASVLIEGEQALIRTGAAAGLACDAATVADLLSLSEPPISGWTLSYTAGSRLPDGAPAGAQAIDHVLEGLYHGAAHPVLDLLQGTYAVRQGFSLGWEPLRLPAALAAGCVAIALIGMGVEHFTLKRERDALDAEIQTRMQRQFPEIRKIVDARVQAERALADLRRGGGGGEFFQLAQAFTGAVQQVPGLEVQGLQLRDGGLFMDLTGRDLQTLESLRKHFAAQPRYRLDVQSANASGGSVQIRASLEPAG